ncbi:BppU family phage baseplate upper protein, partial [Lactobacillus crispatus]|uniref:BppU family phage baseplate upper protein n=1 Tax=Lactobacillus crispatus TaxID=47770 RepID=UPI0030FACC99
MSLAQIVLTTNKTTSNVGDYVRKIGQGERGQILPVIVVDATGTPYDLSDKKIVFSESKDSGKYVVDDGKASTSGKFTLTDPQNGKFSYTLQEQVYPESGTAWFDIVSADGTVLDTTVSFRFVVIPALTLHVNDKNYSSTLEALQAHYQGVIKNTETQTQNLINSLTDKIDQAISNGQNDIANELSDARTKLQAIQDQENKLVSNWTTELNTQKQNFATLQSQWQAQSKSISDDYASKKAKIKSDAQSQHDQIQAKADQQLKNNQSANDAEIAKIKSDAQAQHDQIEKAKTAAI